MLLSKLPQNYFSFFKTSLVIVLLFSFSHNADAGVFSWIKSWFEEETIVVSESMEAKIEDDCLMASDFENEEKTSNAPEHRSAMSLPPCELNVTTTYVENCSEPTANNFIADWKIGIEWSDSPVGDIQYQRNSDAVQNHAPTGTTDTLTIIGVPADGITLDTLKVWFANDVTCADTIIIASPNPCPTLIAGVEAGEICATVASTEIVGTVFEDWNYDGVMNQSDTIGVEAVQVVLTEGNGNAVGTTYTDSNGNYKFSGLTLGSDYRVEFNLPATVSSWASPTKAGTDNGTIVQFLQAGNCANLGIANSDDYCQENPYLVVPCFVGGDNTGTEDVMVRWSHDNAGLLPGDKTKISDANQLGTVWGIAYSKATKTIYTSAVLKSHAGLHEGVSGGGLDAIFEVDPFGATSNGSVWLELTDDLSIDVGTVDNNATRGLGTIPQHDASVYSQIGTVGIGDIDISSDYSTLYVMNLFDKKLYAIDIASKTLIGSYAVPDPGCTNGTYRPWAIEYHKGSVYVGSICDASTAGKDATAADALSNTTGRSDLHAYVYRLDGSTFTEVLDFALDYKKQPSHGTWGNHRLVNGWFPWTNDLPLTATMGGGVDHHVHSYPQPILSDIVFDVDGSMVLGFIDRTALQLGDKNNGPNTASTSIHTVFSGGDILRACPNGANWIIEGTSGSCTNSGGYALGTNTSPHANPNTLLTPTNHNFGEYYSGEFFDEVNPAPTATGNFGHPETAIGSISILPGTGQLISTAFDPISGSTYYKRGGVIFLDNKSGLPLSGFQIYDDVALAFGKGVGLGDLATVCNDAPLEVGHYVWNDVDGDGIQDANESGLAGVTVQLYSSAGALLATTTSDANGHYYFSHSDEVTQTWVAVTDSVEANTSYYIAIGNGLFSNGEMELNDKKYSVTADSTNSGSNRYAIDSDAKIILSSPASAFDGLPAIQFTTGTYGEVNHSLAVGFVEKKSSIGNLVFLDENGDGVANVGEAGIANVKVLLKDDGGVIIDSTYTDALGGYLFKNLENATYNVEIVLATLPTGSSNQTADPDAIKDHSTEIILGVNEENLTASFGYNFVPTTNTNSPIMSTNGAIGDRVWNDTDGDGIQDLGELGINNITVSLYRDDDGDGNFTDHAGTTSTDANGNYIFGGLAANAYVIELLQSDLNSAGFTNAATADPDGDGTNISQPIILAPGDVFLNADFGYKNATDLADIGNQIYVDANANDAYDVGIDVGMAGISVALIVDTNNDGKWDEGEEVAATTITAFDGSYTFADVPAGNYVVAVTDADNVLGILENSFDADGGDNEYSGVTVAAVDILTQDFAYVPAGHVSGQGFVGDLIFLDADANNAFTSGESGIEGVEVQLLDGTTNAVLGTTTTNELGFYFFGNLAADDYKVKINTTTLPSGLTNSIDPEGISGDNISNSFAVGAGAVVTTKDFGYKATTPLTISGTLWNDTNGDGIKDASETVGFQNVSVLLKDPNGNLIGVAATDASGDYSFAGIPNGETYTVEVQDVHNYLNGYWHSLGTDSEATPKTVSLTGSNISGIDFGFYKEGSALGNFVWEDDGDGLQEAGESGIEGAVVTLEIDYNNDGTADVTVINTTDMNGFYSFTNLLLDENYLTNNNTGGPEYTLLVENPNGFSPTMTDVNTNGNDLEDSDNPSGVVVTEGHVLKGNNNTVANATPTAETVEASYDFGFMEGGSIGNLVWLDENSDGIQDAGETGIANIEIELVSGSTVIATDTTDANGGYIFTGVAPATYTVRVKAGSPNANLNLIYDENGGTIIPDGATSVTISTGGEHLTADFGYNWTPKTDTDSPTMAATGALGDRVWNDANGNGIQDAGEAGIENVTIELHTDTDDDGVFTASGTTTMTDAFGNYIFDGLAPAAYVVKVDATTLTGYNTTPTSDPDADADNITQPIIIAPGDAVLTADFGYTPSAGSDIGDVIFVDANGDGTQDVNEAGISNVTVALLNATGEMVATTMTDASGSYAFENLPSGTYTVQITDTENTLGELNAVSDPDGGNDLASEVTVNGTIDDLTQDFGFVPNNHTVGVDGIIGNQVFIDTDNNNAYTAGEGIENVTVNLFAADGTTLVATTTTNETGTYYFGNLDPTETYVVKVDDSTLPSGASYTNSTDPDAGVANESTVDLSVSAGENWAQDFGYQATSAISIAGTVWNDTNADGTKDVAETTNFAGVTVDLLDATGNVISTTTTAVDGTYSFTNILVGIYDIQVTDNANVLLGKWHSLGADSEASTTTVVAVSNVTGVDFGYYSEGATLGNFVWEDDGDGLQEAGETGIEGAVVTLEIDYNNDGTADVTIADTTNASGFYSFENLLLDEDYRINNNTGGPEYNISVATPSDFKVTTNDVNSNANDQEDSDNPAGVVVTDATLIQGQNDVATNADPTLETTLASYDFGFVSTNLTLPINDDENTLVNMAVSGNILTNDFDPESDNITLTGIEDPSNLGTYVSAGTLTTIPGTDESGSAVADAGDITIAANGTYTFTPANDFTGTIELPYQIIDDNINPASEDATLTIIVTGTPDVTSTSENITVANDDENVTFEDVAVSGNVMSNDADPTFDNQTFSGFDDGGFPSSYINMGALNDIGGKDFNGNAVLNAGDLTITSSGGYTFTPETGFTGTVEVPYQVCDDATPQGCAIATLEIKVLPDAVTSDNDKPFAGDDFSTTVLNTPATGDFVSNDKDPNANSISFMGTTINPAVATPTSIGTYATQQDGTIQMFNDGSYIYTPKANYSGPDNFKYQVCDVTATAPQPLCDSATINMTVFPLYRDFSDFDNSTYAAAYNWAATDANSDNVPDATDAFWLGEKVDYEIADHTSAMGDGDDTNGINDDDGLITPANLPVGMTETFTTIVNANSAKTVHIGMWIDWDANGTVDSFYVNSGAADGTSSLNVNTTINVPATYAGGDVYLRQRAFSSEPASGDFGGNSLNGEVEDYVLSFIALPVELSSFTGKEKDCMVELNWVTQSEENFDYFEIQWSGDGHEFKRIDWIENSGNIFGSNYKMVDKTPSANNYYRLKMVDLDGSFEFSKVVYVEINCEKLKNEVNVYPNPILPSQLINIEFLSEKSMEQIVLVDMLGRIVKRLTIETELGKNKITIDLSDLSIGNYVIKIVGSKATKMIQIQE